MLSALYTAPCTGSPRVLGQAKATGSFFRGTVGCKQSRELAATATEAAKMALTLKATGQHTAAAEVTRIQSMITEAASTQRAAEGQWEQLSTPAEGGLQKPVTEASSASQALEKALPQLLKMLEVFSC